MLSRLWSSLKSLLYRKSFEAEMRSELDFHLEARMKHLEEQGLSPSEARRQARVEFGSMERFREECRRARGLDWWDEIGRNLRFALRTYSHDWVFTLTVLATLGICIGAAISVFSVVDAVLWRPLPYPEPERLAFLTEYRTVPTDRGKEEYRLDAHGGANWEVIRDHARGIDRAVYSGLVKGVNLASESGVAFVRQQRVGSGFFRVLGIPPRLGREFTEAEARAGEAVTILSHHLWESVFRSDPHILGSEILLKGKPFQVIGIMPPDFRSTYRADLWTPLETSLEGEGEGPNYGIVARLEDGVGWEQAQAQIASLDLNALSPHPRKESRRLSLSPLQEELTGGLRRPLLMLLTAALALLLVGCANLASLMLARSLTRRQEMATRMALGGGAGAVFRQLIVESLLLGLLGGVVGLVIGTLALESISVVMRRDFDLWQAIGLDWRVATAAFTLSLLASLLFGLAPALQAARTRVGEALVTAGRGTLGLSSHWPRRLFIISEVALVVSLLFISGLLYRSYSYLQSRSPGFNLEGAVTVRYSLEDSRYQTRQEVNRLFDESLAALRRLPAVRSAGVALTLPYERALNLGFRLREGGDEWLQSNVVYVTPELLESLQVPVQEGRTFQPSDGPEATPVVIVNRELVDTYLEGKDALGRWLSVANVDRQIVGVAGNVQAKYAGWGSPGPIGTFPTIYIPSTQLSGGFFQLVHTWFSPSWVIRYQGGAPSPAGIRNVFRQVDPLLPPADIQSPAQLQGEALAQESFQAYFLGGLALTSLLLAAVGLYGLVAGSVLERSQELGIRLALGATPARAVKAVAIPGIRLGLLGLVLGAILSFLLGPLVEHLIWGVDAADPTSFLLAGSSLMVVTTLASLLPALRVVRINPAQTLRGE